MERGTIIKNIANKFYYIVDAFLHYFDFIWLLTNHQYFQATIRKERGFITDF